VEAAGKGLKAGSLGLQGSVVRGIASTAPAYRLAASLGYVVLTANENGIVGVKAPLIMVVAFLPMYVIAVAYSELNDAEPDCGITFTPARGFGTRTAGFTPADAPGRGGSGLRTRRVGGVQTCGRAGSTAARSRPNSSARACAE
jgi:hypothetical protein